MYQQQQQKQRRLEGVAGLLAKQGRYGDSMLVHMNPIEVQGLASMSPTGSLTINPETGQPEAFLPLLVPLLGSMIGSAAMTGIGATAAVAGGAAATGGLSSAAAGAIGSGLAQWAYTGDLEQGLVSGITGFGVGSALGAMGGAGKGAVDAVAGEAVAGAGVDGIVPGTALGDGITSAPSTIQGINPNTTIELGAPGIERTVWPGTFDSANLGAGMGGGSAAPPTPGTYADGTFGERAGQMFSEEGIEALTSPKALIPAALAEGHNAELAAEAAMEDWDKNSGRMSKAELARQGAAIYANRFDPNLVPGSYTPGGGGYGDYGAQYANAGGIVSLDPSDFKKRYNGLMEMGRPIVGMFDGGGTAGDGYNQTLAMAARGLGNYPAQQQAALRGPDVISPEMLQDTYAQQGLPGFGPEIMYFTRGKANPNPFKGWVSDEPNPDDDAQATDGPIMEGDSPLDNAALSELYNAGTITESQYLEALGRNVENAPPTGYVGDGRPQSDASIAAGVEYMESLGRKAGSQPTTPAPPAGSGLSTGAYADLYDEYRNYGSDLGSIGMKEGGEAQVNADADRLIDLAAMAVLGELPEEEAGVVVQGFIDEFGCCVPR